MPTDDLLDRELKALRDISSRSKVSFNKRLKLYDKEGLSYLDQDIGNEIHSFSGSDINIFLMFNAYKISQTLKAYSPRADGDYAQAVRDRRVKEYPPLMAVKEIDTLTISSARSVYPVRALGSSEAKEITRGARTIAGSMIFVTGSADYFAKAADLIRDYREMPKDSAFFVDEVPEFSILIMASNEYGDMSSAFIKDVTISNWGTTFSKNDMYLESTYTYTAKEYYPLLPDGNLRNLIEPQARQNKLSSIFKPYSRLDKDKDPNDIENLNKHIRKMLGESPQWR